VTVRIAPDVEARIRRSPGRVVLQVQGSSDPERAAAALDRARPDLNQLAHKGTREVERIPSGPFVMVVDREDGRKRLLAVPRVAAGHLEAAGVDGTLACIEHGGFLTSPLWGLPTLGPAMSCRLYPPPPEMAEDPPTGIPEGWLDETAAWVTEGLEADHALWAEVGLVEFSLPARDLPPFLEQQQRHRRRALVVAAGSRPEGLTDPADDVRWFCGDDQGRPLRALALSSGPLQSHLALGAGGPGAAPHLPAIFDGFTSLARRLAADLAYGFVELAPTFLRFTGASHPLEPYCDEAVFDGFPYQALGPGHLARLGGPPPGARPLEGGRIELAVGHLSEWISEAEGGATARLGWRGGTQRDPALRLLRPCLDLDGANLRQERWERVQRRRLGLEGLAVPQYRFDPPGG